MSERKFRATLAYADNEWSPDDLIGLIQGTVATIPPEFKHTAKVALVHNWWPSGDSSSYLAITVVMTSSFDYTDSPWEPV